MEGKKSIRVQVHYFGMIKRTAGCSSETVDLPEGSRLEDLVRDLVARHGAAMEQTLLSSGGFLRPEAAVQVNGRNAVMLQGLATPLQEEDQAAIVLLAPPLTGG